MSRRSIPLASRLRGARVLVIGLEPWGVTAALDLAAAGLGTLHLLDDAPLSPGDRHAADVFADDPDGRPRGEALARAITRLAPTCAATWGPIDLADDAGLRLAELRWDLVLACTAADELRVLRAAARLAHAVGAPSLSAHLDGLTAVIGPAVLPGETACWECDRLRRLALSPQPRVDHALQASLLAARPPSRERTYLAPVPESLGHAVALAALDLLRSGAASRFAGVTVVQHVVELETTRHTALPMPWCDVCGGARARLDVGRDPPESLDTARTTDELRRRLAGVVDPRSGIVRQLEIDRPNSAVTPDLPITATAVLGRYTEGVHCPAHCGTPSAGAGKGGTPVEALLSAVGEAVERYSAGRFRVHDLRRAPVAAMTGDFIDPARLALYSDEQYARPDFPHVRLAPHTAIDWTLGRWLDDGAPVAVPALPVYYNYPVAPDAYFCQVTSNGLAAGASRDDAALRATLELVERDAFMLTWLARRPGRRLLLDRPIDPTADEVTRQLAERGVQLELYLLDVGLAVPVVLSVGLGDGARWPGATVALAAHLSPRIAVRKAILEQAHVGPYLHRKMIAGLTIPDQPDDVRTLEDHAAYYFPPSRADAFAFLGAGAPLAARDLDEPDDLSLAALTRTITAAGLRVAVVDVTAPDLAATPFRVARAVGPEFQQIHFGHHVARLGNPRLLAMAVRGINPDPHPMA